MIYFYKKHFSIVFTVVILYVVKATSLPNLLIKNIGKQQAKTQAKTQA